VDFSGGGSKARFAEDQRAPADAGIFRVQGWLQGLAGDSVEAKNCDKRVLLGY